MVPARFADSSDMAKFESLEIAAPRQAVIGARKTALFYYFWKNFKSILDIMFRSDFRPKTE